MLIYRDGRRTASGHALLARLCEACDSASLTTVLLRAGELECGIADACGTDDDSASTAAEITDSAARSFLRNHRGELQRIRSLAEKLHVPDELRVSAPEGFAYYALAPCSYAELAGSLEISNAAVIGIRSIGATLSAVVCEALRARGRTAERITVRPHGHPFDRETRLRGPQFRWVSAHSLMSDFLIVDEGPGLSGSSLLSVAEALLAQGVPAGRIHFLCGHAPDLDRLCAPSARLRWQRFHCHPVSASVRPAGAELWIGAGEWRRQLLPTGSVEHWPPVWKTVERAKYFSADRNTIFKFEGFGHYGEAVVARSRALAEVGFAPAFQDFNPETGFAQYEFRPGCSATAGDVSQALLKRMAAYLAARLRLFPITAGQVTSDQLATMARVNAQKGLGMELDLNRDSLPVVRPVICDNRMMPREWLFADDGRILKLDAAAHGDDHFFPGPSDIAWDLAGSVIEWNLSESASDLLLNEYKRLTGDDAAERLPDYLLAYSLFRLGYCMMAVDAMAGSEEQPRFERACGFYRAQAEALVAARRQGRALAQISG